MSGEARPESNHQGRERELGGGAKAGPLSTVSLSTSGDTREVLSQPIHGCSQRCLTRSLSGPASKHKE